MYLDNAATAQKPQKMLDAIVEYYTEHNANVHRGVHQLSEESSEIYERSRQKMAAFFEAHPDELILGRNATEMLNLVAWQWGRKWVQSGDVIAVSAVEHHSNLVPWQELAKETGARLVTLPHQADGTVDEDAAHDVLLAERSRLKIIAVNWVSNVLGTVFPLAEVAHWLEDWEIRDQVWFAVDAAQAVPHIPVHFSQFPADFLAFSGHKLYGPMGIGGLLVKRERLRSLPPLLYGGGMIDEVTWNESSYATDLAQKFTAGTPDVASLVGMVASLEYVEQIGWPAIEEHERTLVQTAYQKLQAVNGVSVLGPDPGKKPRIGSVSWVYKGVHAHDVAQILDRQGVAVRSGHHCVMPIHTEQNWVATTRASFALYNTLEEIDVLVEALQAVRNVFSQ